MVEVRPIVFSDWLQLLFCDWIKFASLQPLKRKMASLATAFIDLLRNSGESVPDAELQQHFGEKYKDLVPVINDLSKQGRIKMLYHGAELVYDLVSDREAQQMKGLTAEHRIVLQEIEKAGNMGIWTRDIKIKTSLPQQIVTKILKLLETRRLVKSVKSISSKNKKLYMLFDVIPSREITGGPWYNEQEFDHVFIEALSKFVYEVIRSASVATLKDLTEKVRASGISKVALGPEEVFSIIKILMYDGRIEQVTLPRGCSSQTLTQYKISAQISTLTSLTDMPCGVCPVFAQCQEGNIISPSTCEYMAKWLELKDIDF